MKHYPDQPANETRIGAAGVTATRTQKVAYVATQPGTVTLPRLEIEWWNTASRHMERAALPARDIVFAPAPDGGGTGPAAVVPAPGLANDVARAESAPEVAVDATTERGDVWRYVAMAAFAAWVVTLLVWWRHSLRRRGAASGAANVSAGGGKKSAAANAVRAVRAACKAGDVARLRDELLKFGASRWPDAAPKSLGELAVRVRDDAAREALWSVEKRLYKSTDGEAPLGELCGVLEKWVHAERDARAARRERDTLQPLYPER
jgi:hypothetical protein